MRNLENAIKKVHDFKGTLSQSIIVGTAKGTLNQYSRGWIKPKTTETAEAIDQFGVEEFLEVPLLNRKLDENLTLKGIQFLNKYLFTKKDQPRKTKDTKNLPDLVFEVVKNFSHFTFAGFQDVGQGNYSLYTPIWEVHSNDGRSFQYIYGGNFSGCGLECFNYNWTKTK